MSNVLLENKRRYIVKYDYLINGMIICNIMNEIQLKILRVEAEY